MKKKAVLLINSLVSGGAERVVLTQAEELLRQGISVTLLLVQNEIQYTPDPRIHIICLSQKKKPGVLTRLFQLPLLAAKLNRILQHWETTETIVLLAAHLPYCYLLAALTRYRNRFLYVLHTPHYWMPGGNTFFFRKALQLLYNRKKLICVSKGVETELKNKYHVKPKAVATIYNPLNFEKIDRLKKEEPEIKLLKPYFLFCGRLNQGKRIDRLIRAFAQGGFAKNYHLVVLGVGEQEAALKKLALDLGLKNDILFPGWSDNVYAWMSHAALFVLSSDYEAFPMALCEALYCGCPVVSVNCRYGPAELMTGKLSPYLARPNAEDLAAKMQLALDAYPDNLKEYCSDLTASHNIASYLSCFARWDKNGRS